MGWAWSISNIPVQVYCKDLWENKYKRQYANICYHFFAQAFELILGKPAPILSDEAMQVLSNIGDWYIEKDFTYIRIYGATAAPHLLPKFVLDRLVLREIAYQTILHGFNAFLVKEKLKSFISYSLYIGRPQHNKAPNKWLKQLPMPSLRG